MIKMDYSKMSREQLLKELESKKPSATKVYISRRNPNVICVKPPNRKMFPISASKEDWQDVLEVVDQIKALL